MIRLIVILIFSIALSGCKKDHPCERLTGNLVIWNSMESKQIVTVEPSIIITVDGLSHSTIFDLDAGDYEVNAINQNTGATVQIFVKIEPCEDSEITI